MLTRSRRSTSGSDLDAGSPPDTRQVMSPNGASNEGDDSIEEEIEVEAPIRRSLAGELGDTPQSHSHLRNFESRPPLQSPFVRQLNQDNSGNYTTTNNVQSEAEVNMTIMRMPVGPAVKDLLKGQDDFEDWRREIFAVFRIYNMQGIVAGDEVLQGNESQEKKSCFYNRKHKAMYLYSKHDGTSVVASI